MAMSMLAAGGMPLLTDGVRQPDESNPRGYFELEAVKELHRQRDMSWLDDARGKAVKIVSFLLTWLPETCNYKVVFMQRDLREVMASETAMLRNRGQATPSANEDQTIEMYREHLEKVDRFLATRGCFETLRVNYRDALDKPEETARHLRNFVGRPLDVARMANVADRSLYRNRASS